MAPACIDHGAAAPGLAAPERSRKTNAAELGSMGGAGEQGLGDESLHCAVPDDKAHLTPRHLRLLRALLAGPCSREEVDRITGASNGPDEVLKLRRLYGLQVPCERHAGRDRDARPVEFGIYRLTDLDAARARELLEVAP